MRDPNPLLLAGAGTGSGTSGAESLPVVIGTAAVVLIVIARVRGRALRPRRLLVLPAVLLALGIAAMLPQLLGQVRLHGIDAALIACDLVLSVGLGAVRGRTVLIYLKAGRAWYRYGPVTVGLWLLSIVLRFALGVWGSRHGASPLATSASVLSLLGLTLLTQNVIVRRRGAIGSGNGGK